MKKGGRKEMNDIGETIGDTFFISEVKEKDEVFEAQFSLAMIQAGYDSLNDVTINNIKEILDSPEYSSDYRINSLKSDFEKTIKIWGFNS